MIPQRIQDIDINKKSFLSILHGQVDDIFVGRDTIKYNIEEVLYLYLKKEGFDAVVFYNKTETFYSFSEQDLDVFFTDERIMNVSFKSKKNRKGPLGIVSSRNKPNQISKKKSGSYCSFLFPYCHVEAYRGNSSNMLSSIMHALEKQKYRIALIINQAMVAGDRISSVFSISSEINTCLIGYSARQHALKQQHKVIVNYEVQNVFKIGDFPHDIENQLCEINQESISLKKNCDVHIGLPKKDEFKYLLNNYRFNKNLLVQWDEFDRILELLEKEDYTVQTLKEKIESFLEQHNKLTIENLLETGIISDSNIVVDFNLLESELRCVKGQSELIDIIKISIGRWVKSRGERKPLSFFAVGTSGVGKTYTAKKIAESLSHNGFKFVNFKMTEFQEEHHASKFTGSEPPYANKRPQLLEELKKSKRLVIVFDEIEKAHNKVIMTLMELIDDGVFTWSDEKGDFSECILFFTSNLEREKVVEAKNSFLIKSRDKTKTLMDNKFQTRLKNIFSKSNKLIPPEFWGRIGRYLVFNTLKEQDVIEISIDMIRNIASDYDINICSISSDYLAYLADAYAGSPYGVRGLKETVNDDIIDIIQKEE